MATASVTDHQDSSLTVATSDFRTSIVAAFIFIFLLVISRLASL